MTIKIIAEIGINHKGSFLKAKKIIDIASKSGAWAIKFQYRDYNNFYLNKNQIGDEVLSQEIKKNYINFKKIDKLRKYAKKLQLKTGISFFKKNDFIQNKKYIKNFDFLKIPSSEFNNTVLIEEYRKTGKKIFISTGGNNKKEILESIKNLKGNNYVVLHCISNYPTLTGFQQLSFIKELIKKTKFDIGYSSHDEDWEVNLIAMYTGIKYIERHLTIDKNENGLDDSSSSEKNDFAKLCYFAKMFKHIIGNGNRKINQIEKINMQNLGTSFYAKKNIKKNTLINVNDFFLKAPRIGITEKEFFSLKRKKINQDMEVGSPLIISNFDKKIKKLNESQIFYCNQKNIALPIRIHDYKAISSIFPIQNFELHLSSKEVYELSKKNFEILKLLINKNKSYSIHLPDYISNNSLIDPVSNNKQTAKESLLIIKKVKEISKFINDYTNQKVKVVGSFSRVPHKNKIKSLDMIFDCLFNLSNKNFKILPQWLPKIACYFGGGEIQKLFSDNEDINYIVRNNISICLDISHLILSANYANENWKKWYDKLINNTELIHLADAKGIDGEGIELGTGELGNFSYLIKNKNVKVLETWQGHLNNGSEFFNTIKYLIKNYG